MRVLHLASFVGNIGDIANHEGLYYELKSIFQQDLIIDKLEMRLFYKNLQKRKFDNEFAELVNEYDLLIIGGGNFFELCWEYSATGTTFDISEKILNLIKTPILINAIGIDLDKGYSESTIEKFRLFLSNIFSINKVFFTIRNDGSKEVVRTFFKEFEDKIYVVPDYGFFIKEALFKEQYELENKINYIGLNLAVDMYSIRFKYREYNEFIIEMANIVNEILDNYDVNIYLFAHIQSDYIAIVDILKHIKNYYVRSRVSISSLVVGNELETFRRYNECKIILGMRNHSTICSIGLGIPSFGMTSYKKPEYIYNELNLNNRYLNISNANFFEKVLAEVKNVLGNENYAESIKSQYAQALNVLCVQKQAVNKLLIDWLKENKVL